MSGLYKPADEISPTGIKSWDWMGAITSRTGRKLFKNKGLRTIAASETFFFAQGRKACEISPKDFWA